MPQPPISTQIPIKELLLSATTHLASHSTSPRLDAEVLLSLTLAKPRSYLHAWPEQHPSAEQISAYEQLVKRRSNGEPIAHLTGEREFWSLVLKVSPDTLIPRPETEQLVEQTLTHIAAQQGMQVADLGTGSGAIALAIAHERPNCGITAVDSSASALKIAKANAARLNIGNIHFHHGDWLQGLPATFDIIVSNPPYIRPDDPHLQQGDLLYEPATALVATDNGMAAINRICHQAREHLKPGGWLLLEHGYDQRQAVIKRLQQEGYSDIQAFKDLSGNDRLVQARMFHSKIVSETSIDH
jgi:release factor glutamine methyltransferase